MALERSIQLASLADTPGSIMLRYCLSLLRLCPARFTCLLISADLNTVVQAAEQRTAIGSALLEHGLGRGSKVGLCSVNCRGELAEQIIL